MLLPELPFFMRFVYYAKHLTLAYCVLHLIS